MSFSPTIRDENGACPEDTRVAVRGATARVADWAPFVILMVAAFFRFAWLDLKPPHHDEGVVATMAEDITARGYYEYNPADFHGPLPFYLSFVSQRLFGRSLFAMRLPVVMLSVMAVGLLLAYREYFAERAVRWAALAMAVSSTMVYFGRQCAHEMGLMFFNVLAVWGAVGICRGGKRRDLWALGLGIAGMALCKETYAIHTFALVIAAPAMWVAGKLWPLPEAKREREWDWRDVAKVTCGSLAVVIFFYSGTFMDWKGVTGLWKTWAVNVAKGVSSDAQSKDLAYYPKLLLQYEWTMILGIVASLPAIVFTTRRETRYMALVALAGACGYNLVAYKTPWLLMSWGWPFYILFGSGVVAASQYIGRVATRVAAGIVVALMAAKSCHLNFYNYAPPGDTDPYPEPYAYVQALDDIKKITEPLNALASMDPAMLHIPGAMIGGEQFPLVWQLSEFTRIGWYGKNEEGKYNLPSEWNLDFIQAHVDVAAEVEKHLTEAYFREDNYQIRNMGGDRSVLYFRASVFAPVFFNRSPEFIPTSSPEKPAEPPQPAVEEKKP